MFLGLKNGEAKYLLLAVIVLTALGGYQISVTCTVIGKNNTLIAKTARLSVLRIHKKNYFF